MTQAQKKVCALYASILVLVFCVDRLTKAWALQSLAATGTRILIPNLLELTLVQNTRVIFFLRWPVWGTVCIVVIVMIAVVGALVKAARQHTYELATAYGLIFVGAYSNVWDRVHLGAVTDFIDIPFWSVFNIADICIVVGVCIAAWCTRTPSSALKKRVDKTQKNATL